MIQLIAVLRGLQFTLTQCFGNKPENIEFRKDFEAGIHRTIIQPFKDGENGVPTPPPSKWLDKNGNRPALILTIFFGIPFLFLIAAGIFGWM